MRLTTMKFPEFSGIRCLMMPYIQGDSKSAPKSYAPYADVLDSVVLKKGDIGFLTIDESTVKGGSPHRGTRAKFARALHTEAGRDPEKLYCWGTGWGKAPHRVTLDRDVEILLANNLDDSCAIWDVVHEDTSSDGDIGHASEAYPYTSGVLMKAGEIHKIGILTPHESIPVRHDFERQFLRIISSGVYGREHYFTENPLMPRSLSS